MIGIKLLARVWFGFTRWAKKEGYLKLYILYSVWDKVRSLQYHYNALKLGRGWLGINQLPQSYSSHLPPRNYIFNLLIYQIHTYPLIPITTPSFSPLPMISNFPPPDLQIPISSPFLPTFPAESRFLANLPNLNLEIIPD